MSNFLILKPFILRYEGGYVNDPLDRGGATNSGITLATFQSVYGKNKTKNDLKNMTEDQWDYIFKKYFWDKCKATSIKNQSIANIIVDWVWASGPLQIKKVQRIVGVKDDGIIGNKTIAAINNANQKELFNKLHTARINFVNAIVKNNPSQKRFIKGWTNRINAIKFEA